MHAMILATVAGIVLLVGGCGGKPHFENPEKAPAQENADYSDCDWEASKATANLANTDERQDRITELVDKCMKAKGYTKK
jgi:hypothetical protein